MRKFLLTAAATVAILVVPALASAQVYAADVYPAPGAVVVNPPGAVVVNPPGAVVVNPPAVVAAPLVESQVYLAPGQTYVAPGQTYAAPMVESQVYLAPGQNYVVPGQAFDDQAVIINGQRYYRDCWWDWGRRQCALKPWW